MTAPTDVPVGNVYDKEAADNPIERRLVAGPVDAPGARPAGRVEGRVVRVELGLGQGQHQLLDQVDELDGIAQHH